MVEIVKAKDLRPSDKIITPNGVRKVIGYIQTTGMDLDHTDFGRIGYLELQRTDVEAIQYNGSLFNKLKRKIGLPMSDPYVKVITTYENIPYIRTTGVD